MESQSKISRDNYEAYENIAVLVPCFAFCVSTTTRMSALNLNRKSIYLSVSRRNLRISKGRSDTLEYLDFVNIHRKLGFKGPG